jgi:hypothetical protein
MIDEPRRRGWLVPALVAALLFVLGAGAWTIVSGSGCGLPEDPGCIRVLFIGNSYTSVNDLPGTFARLARSGGLHVETSMIAPGGAFLADHAANPDVAAAASDHRLTAVVLQEQSELPAAPGALETRILPAAEALVQDATIAGARPFLLETWAHRDGWPDGHLDRAAMQVAINSTYRDLGARLGAMVVPAGEAWARLLRQAPAIDPWQADGSHPSSAGTYLAACVLYATLTGRSPVGLSETGGLAAADAATLQRIAIEP